jgi:hypothetical protein
MRGFSIAETAPPKRDLMKRVKRDQTDMAERAGS